MRPILSRLLETKRAAFLAALLPACAMASNGVYDIGTGAKIKGVGGASTAFAQDTFSILANPANLSELCDGFDVSALYHYSSGQTAKISNVSPVLLTYGLANSKFPINGHKHLVGGSLGFSRMINNELTFGLVFAPESGGILQAQNQIPANASAFPLLQGNHERAFYVAVTPTLSYKPCGSNQSIGIGIDFAGAALKLTNFQTLAQGLFGPAPVAHASAHPNHITNKGWAYSWGAGVRLGWLWDVTPNFKVGLSYKTKTFMSRVKRYEGIITPNGYYQLPAVLNAGFAWKFMPNATLAFDVSHIFNRDVPSLANQVATIFVDLSGPFPTFTNLYPHGANHGAAFKWKSQTAFKVGIAYDLNCEWTLRLGYNHCKNPVPKHGTFSSTFLIPAVIEDYLTLGATWNCSANSNFSFSYVHGFKNTYKGYVTAPVRPAAAEAIFNMGAVKGDLTAQSDQVEIQYGYNF